mgnify:CR=1 FL=1
MVLASRPYQNDSLVNHDLPEMLCGMGIPVLTADSVPGAAQVDLSCSRLDVVNNFHARMLSTAILAAENPHLEYIQIVSFGCGHDAYLSDEIIRLMKEISGKTPLVLKLDESDIQGPLRIRVRSFLETVAMGREQKVEHAVQLLKDPYPVKFEKTDRQKTVLVPNTSHAFSRIMSAAFSSQGLRAVRCRWAGRRPSGWERNMYITISVFRLRLLSERFWLLWKAENMIRIIRRWPWPNMWETAPDPLQRAASESAGRRGVFAGSHPHQRRCGLPQYPSGF